MVATVTELTVSVLCSQCGQLDGIRRRNFERVAGLKSVQYVNSDRLAGGVLNWSLAFRVVATATQLTIGHQLTSGTPVKISSVRALKL